MCFLTIVAVLANNKLLIEKKLPNRIDYFLSKNASRDINIDIQLLYGVYLVKC